MTLDIEQNPAQCDSARETSGACPDGQPLFSVIIPTRNRLELFREALDSVLQQTCRDMEVIVVNDGSVGEVLDQYKALEADYPTVSFCYLVHRPNGHGQSYSMNYGAGQAQGRYLCFLDDDDYWTDPGHLARVKASLQLRASVDLYLTNQEAYTSAGQMIVPNPWIKDLNERLPRSGDRAGSVQVDTGFLLQSRGFAHLNCSIYRREFYLALGGMDENIRYECDRDIFIRAIDLADVILLNPAVISYHRVPDAKKSTNMSTMVSTYQKRLYQLAVYEKGVLHARSPELRRFCSRGKGYQLKHIAEALAAERRYRLASQYAWQGLALLPGMGWALRALEYSVRAILDRH